jgi:beta-lactamase class A
MKKRLLKYTLGFVFTAITLFFAVLMADANAKPQTSIQEKLVTLEASAGGRLGVYAINTGNNERIQYRAEERFPFCSTFKVMGVAAILKQNMTNHHLLEQKIKYRKEDIDIVWSPITDTEKHIADGMTISELAAAAIMYSDDTAINLLVKELGGSEAVNIFARSIGDNTFRLDRREPELNTAIPGDVRDTTTPKAMATSLQRLVLGDVLASPQRKQLQAWLEGNTTGNFRIRAGVPKDWVVGDKTGGGKAYGVTNDIAIIWPPKCAPIIIAIYFTQNEKDAPHREDIVASATRLILSEFRSTDKCKI